MHETGHLFVHISLWHGIVANCVPQQSLELSEIINRDDQPAFMSPFYLLISLYLDVGEKI